MEKKMTSCRDIDQTKSGKDVIFHITVLSIVLLLF